MKRKLYLEVRMLFMMMLVLVACGDDKETSNQTDGENQGASSGEPVQSESIVTPAGEFPIVKEKATLDVLVPSNAFVQDFKTNEFTKWYEEKTGVHVNWEVVPEEGVQEKLNLILTSGDYPDVIMNMPVTVAQLRVYGEKRVFLPLNDLIEEFG